MTSQYQTASLDQELVEDLKKIYKEQVQPLGIVKKFSVPVVIRYLVNKNKESQS